MYSVGGETTEVKEELGTYVKNLGKGRGKSKGVGGIFQGSSSGVTNFWDKDVGDDPPHGPGPGGVPTQGSSTDHWEEDTEVIGWFPFNTVFYS